MAAATLLFSGSAHYSPAHLPVKPRGKRDPTYSQPLPSAARIAWVTSLISAIPSTVFSFPVPR